MVIFFVNWSVVVPGASDNLTGSFVSVALAKYFHDKNIKLKNTEVYFMVTGSEEVGLRGAKAFVKKRNRELSTIETVAIASDTFTDLEYLSVMEKDLHGTVKRHPGMCLLLKKSAENVYINIKNATVVIGSTDATAFTQGGIPACGLTAMDPAPPKWYHTHFDTEEWLNPECIENSLSILIEAVKNYDKSGLSLN